MREVTLILSLALGLLAGCDSQGVCVRGDECHWQVQKSACGDGEWHAYADGDGDLGSTNGLSTCSRLGYGEFVRSQVSGRD